VGLAVRFVAALAMAGFPLFAITRLGAGPTMI
jgi:hypothetical protein